MAVTSWLIDKSAYGGSNSAKQQTVTRLELAIQHAPETWVPTAEKAAVTVLAR
jgi:hypothetical protein